MWKITLLSIGLSLFGNLPLSAVQWYPNTGLVLKDYLVEQILGKNAGRVRQRSKMGYSAFSCSRVSRMVQADIHLLKCPRWTTSQMKHCMRASTCLLYGVTVSSD